jgi:hypothetical protein
MAELARGIPVSVSRRQPGHSKLRWRCKKPRIPIRITEAIGERIICNVSLIASGLELAESVANNAVHLIRRTFWRFEASGSLQPACRVNAVIRPSIT